MDAEAIIARLKDQVPGLRQVGVAADLDAVLKGGPANTHTGASAFIIATAERGGQPQLAAGSYRQPLHETISIVILVREISNRKGDKPAVELEGLKKAVREAIAGWKPEGAFGPYALVLGTIVAFRPGTLAWAFEFTAADQIRIST
ncbi:hypothetical protein [Paracoccus sp. IB05]|uniref:phage tail terminator protein n=1 Tax=Paracoccus sp. IB05 TaxID=2779367 RepID=UPI0018E71331|nr:hypothetical protein [Paracoccus sp. IB05]MBJ2150607.1 hypothetical protein [Paracoccus sp. IB05]